MMVGLTLTTLRLNRSLILLTLLVVGALAATAVITAFLGAAAIDASQVSHCRPDDCAAAAVTAGRGYYRLFGEVLPFLALLPAAIGALWGAPLISREYETGTAKLAWTQSVSRGTWVCSRMVVLGAVLAICGAVLGASVGYWVSIFEGVAAFSAGGQVLVFGQIRGLGPLAWLLVAFTLGAFCGAVLRRTVPAMAVTIVVLVAATVLRNLWTGSMTAGEPLTTTIQLQRFEVLTLVLVSVVLTAATVWVAQRATV